MRVRGGGYLPDITYIDCSRILGFLVYHRYSMHASIVSMGTSLNIKCHFII